MSDDGTLRALEARVDELKAHVEALLRGAEGGGLATAKVREAAERLASAVEAVDHAVVDERHQRDDEAAHLGEVLEAIFAVAALDFTRRAPVRGSGPLDALALSLNMLTEELDEAQKRLVEAKSAAEAATVAKSRFLAQMSHEIRTPLTTLLGFADMLAAPSLGESDRLNYAMIVRRNGEHLLSVINDILDLSKIEAGKLKLEIIECSPVTLLSDLDSLLRARAIDHGLAFDIELATPIPLSVRTDPTRLRQVLLNVIGNAIKFTQSGGVRVRVAYDPAAARLRVDVVDTGIGLRADQLSKLFQPFEQADLSMTRRYGGSGLGLAISRGLVTALGGEIGATSQPGLGSTFTISVPVTAAGAQMVSGLSEARRVAAMAPSPAARLCGAVLLAEDGPDNQILITTLLRKYGLDVTVAENGAVAVDHALEALRAGRPFDLVLMDMQMPVLDGYDATRKLRASGYAGAIVALTAHAMGGERERCLAAGCDEYVRKPIDRTELFETLRRFVAARKPAAPEVAPAADGEAIVSAFGEDPDMVEIVDRFVASLPSRVTALRFEHAAGDAGRANLQRLAHQLKGGAGGYGFPAITEAAAAIERAVVDAGGSDDVAAALDALAALCGRARSRAS